MLGLKLIHVSIRGSRCYIKFSLVDYDFEKITVYKVGPGVLCNIGYPSETHLKLKSSEILLVHNIRFSGSIHFKFCTEHGSITAMLCAKFQNDWITNK